MTEREFERAVIEALDVFGWRWCHFRPGRTASGWRTALSGAAGFPDIVAVRGERVLFIELKAEGGRLSGPQREWLAELERAGQDVRVWRPDDWDEIKAALR